MRAQMLTDAPKATDASLSEVLTVIRGVSYSKDDASASPAPGLTPILRATNIQDRLTFDELVYVPKGRVSHGQMLKPGDIVLAASSGSRNIVGKTAQLVTEWEGSFGAFCFALRPNPNIHPRYLAWFLQTPQYRSRVTELSAGVNINNLRASQIESIPIPLPSLEVQEQIAAQLEEQLSHLDVGVAALQRTQANLDRYRTSTLSTACLGRLIANTDQGPNVARPRPGTQQLPVDAPLNGATSANVPSVRQPLPQGWAWATIGELLSEPPTNGISIKGSDSPPGTPALRLSAMSDQGFEYSDVRYLQLPQRLSKDIFIRAQDFFVSRGNGSLHLVGRGTLAQEPPQPTIFPDTMIRLRLRPEVRDTGWIPTIWSSPLVRRQIECLVKTTAGIYKISQPQIRSISVPLPPPSAQRSIAKEANRLLEEARDLEAAVLTQLQQAQSLRRAILAHAFHG